MKNLIFALICICSFSVVAQRYTSSLGLRGGSPGVTYLNAKYRINQQSYELGIGGNTSSVWVHGNAYYQNELNDILDYYYGFGANVGLGDMSKFETNYSGLGLGASAVIGLEHTLEDFPLNVSIDVGPSLYVLPRLQFGFAWALSVRYVLH
jgi:hypothetical protein